MVLPPRLAFGDSLATVIGLDAPVGSKVVFDVMLRRVLPGILGDPPRRERH